MCLCVLLDLMFDWYSKLVCAVRQNSAESAAFCVKSGVKQRGVLSHLLYNFYINDLICSLKNSKLKSKLTICTQDAFCMQMTSS